MKVLPCKRWAVVHDHDGSPIDGNLYVHKAKAIRRKNNHQNPEKFRVEQVAIISSDMADLLMKSNG